VAEFREHLVAEIHPELWRLSQQTLPFPKLLQVQDEDETPKIDTAYVRQMQLSSNMFGPNPGGKLPEFQSDWEFQPC
jgi:hypothetical protein